MKNYDEELWPYLIVNGGISLPDEICRENQNSHSIFSTFFFPENHAVFEIMWKNV